MVPYLLLLLIPGLCAYVAVVREKNGTICFGTSEYIRKNNVSTVAFFICLFLLLCLRDESIGRDLPSYKSMFNSYGEMSFRQIFNSFLRIDGQILFVLLNKVVYVLTHSFRAFLCVIAFLTLFPEMLLYREERENGFLAVLLYANMTTLCMLFSGIRQSLAMGIGVLAYFCVRKKKLLKFILWCLIAMGVHHSAFMLFFLYPLYYLKFRKITILVAVFAWTTVFAFKKTIFDFVTGFLADFSGKYNAQATSTNAYMSLVLFILFAVFICTITFGKDNDEETNGLRNFAIFSGALQCFAPLYATAMRLNYYYILFLPIAVSRAIDQSAPKYRSLANAGKFVLVVFFLIYYVKKTVEQSITGISDLDTYPYRFFWEVIR